MLVCGEDLGMVPDCVPGVMDATGVLSLRVQRMPADEKLDWGIPEHYPYMSVCSTSSHDTSTLRGWWEEDREMTQKFWNHMLSRPGAAPAECTPEVAWMVLDQHLWSKSMWAIFPIQVCGCVCLCASGGFVRRSVLPRDCPRPRRTGWRWTATCVQRTRTLSASTCLLLRSTTGGGGCM